MTPEELVLVLAGAAGVVIQLAVTFIPGFSNWFQNHEKKGLIVLGINIGVALAYFGLGCVPFLALQLGILVSCDVPGGILLAKAIFIMITSQQMAYAVTKQQVKSRFDKISF